MSKKVLISISIFIAFTGLFGFIIFICNLGKKQNTYPYLPYGKIIVEAYSKGIVVINNHIFEDYGWHHSVDCPYCISKAYSINNIHTYDRFLEAVKYYDTHPDEQWVVGCAIGSYDKIHKKIQ